jgi:enoyl-CoA hydratase/carnithine racemase
MAALPLRVFHKRGIVRLAFQGEPIDLTPAEAWALASRIASAAASAGGQPALARRFAQGTQALRVGRAVDRFGAMMRAFAAQLGDIMEDHE